MPTKITSGMGQLAPLTIGKYTLLQRIAAGGMAEIWVAKSAGYAGSDRLCVIKMILPNIVHDPKAVQMFLDEARIAATLQHQNIVQMYEVGEMEDNYFIAMEYLHGEDARTMLRHLAKRRDRLPIEHALHIAVGMLAGLHYAHSKKGIDGKPLGIVHRDVSPHNLFVTYDGAVKLVDFGIAKAANRTTQTKIETLKGKVRYMSPEQCRCLELDHRSDIYSAGIVLYELTTNRQLNPGVDEYEIMKRTVDGPIPDPCDVVEGYPPDLAKIVRKALAKRPHDRYQTALQMQEALEQFAFDGRLRRSAISMADYMHDVFDDRIRTWNEGMEKGTNIREMIAARHRRADSHSDLGIGITDDEETKDTRPRDSVDYDPAESTSPGTAQSVTMASGEIRVSPSRSKWGWIAAVLLLVGGAAGGAYVYIQSQERSEIAAGDETPPAAAATTPVPASDQSDPAAERVRAGAGEGEAGDEPTDDGSSEEGAADDGSSEEAAAGDGSSEEAAADDGAAAAGAPPDAAESPTDDPPSGESQRALTRKAKREARRKAAKEKRARRRAENRARREAEAKAERKTQADADKQPVSGKGELRLASKPSCKVIINGTSRGDTPLALELPAGKHRIRLINRDFGIDATRSVTVKPGAVTKKRYSGASLMQ